ncbi:MAG TPA: helix-turn-helix transcriptional regulator [Fimbriimonadaceae bacterium]|jgi:transcriptional regulator with XRE-family HTH domain
METNDASFITDLIAEECERDPAFRIEYEAEKLMRYLIQARIKSNLTQGQVALAMGVHQPAVVRIESKPETASFGRLLNYANAVGVELTPPRPKQHGVASDIAPRSKRRPRSTNLSGKPRTSS